MLYFQPSIHTQTQFTKHTTYSSALYLNVATLGSHINLSVHEAESRRKNGRRKLKLPCSVRGGPFFTSQLGFLEML